MTALLHRIGDFYKNPKLVRDKSDNEVPEYFLKELCEMLNLRELDLNNNRIRDIVLEGLP